MEKGWECDQLAPLLNPSLCLVLDLKLWDKDILKWDDLGAEGLLDLGPHFRKAYKTRDVVKLFEDPKKVEKRLAQQKERDAEVG